MIEEELIRLRRHFHKYAEPAWMEFLTTVKIIEELKNYNLDLYYGKEIYFNKRMGLPEKSILESYKNSISISNIEKKKKFWILTQVLSLFWIRKKLDQILALDLI